MIGKTSLRPISEAKRDGTHILAKTKKLLPGDEHLQDRWFVIFHKGQNPSGFDLGWCLYPGKGVADSFFEGWTDLPEGK